MSRQAAGQASSSSRQAPPTGAAYRGHPVLYVDDDQANLKSFRFLLGGSFEIVTAASGEEALGLLAAPSKPVAVLLSDQRLGTGMAGTELCAVVRERHPEVVRMIVTAYSDLPSTIAGINAGQISRYITKPWKKDEMDAALRAGIDEHYFRALARRTQELLLDQQRTTAEVLLGRVVRQMCNPTTAAHMNLVCADEALETLMTSLGPGLTGLPSACGETLRELREMIRDASSAVTEIVSHLEWLRRGELSPAPAGEGGEGESDVDRVVSAAIMPLRAEISRRAALVIELGAEPKVAVGRSYLARIILNLLPIAVTACDPGRVEQDRIVITTFTTSDGTGGFSIRHPLRHPPADDEDPRGLSLTMVSELVIGAGGRFRVLEHRGGDQELVVELPLAGRERG